MEAFTQALLLAMKTWVPLAQHSEPEPETLARYESIAEDISAIARDEAEPPILGSRALSALVLANIAALETSYSKFVDDGTCNQKDFVPDRRGSCDDKHAFTIWQIHTGSGLMLSGDGLTSAFYASIDAREHPERVWTGKRLLGDRKAAARVALHIVRVSIRETKTLCQYTGEDCKGEMPKAKIRLGRAIAYAATHSF
jgi:hypothetical protein